MKARIGTSWKGRPSEVSRCGVVKLGQVLMRFSLADEKRSAAKTGDSSDDERGKKKKGGRR